MNHTARRISASFTLVFVLAATACTPHSESTLDHEEAVAAVRSVLESQQEAWNRGDLERFMAGYEKSDKVTFVSGDEIVRGWQTVLDRYRMRYPSGQEMGGLSFSDLEIQTEDSSHAVADGRWQLRRKGDTPHGRFTLLFRREGTSWRIFHDTTTLAPE